VGDVRHLYVHLPFCAHRCGYCDFVTVVGRSGEHARYVEALLAELGLEAALLADRVETVFVGGGTPTFADPPALERLLASLPDADEVTVEANPESVTPSLARLLARHGVDRVSIGAQTFQTHLLDVLERRARSGDVGRALELLRDAGLGNVSLDLIYGIPGESAVDLERDLEAALALAPDHLSCYELEAKPGTRFTHVHGEALARQAEGMEGYFERVVDVLTGAGYRWYETANFCRPGRESRHNLAYWSGRDYLGLGIGAVSTVGERRWRNGPRLGPYMAALDARERPPREHEELGGAVRSRERLMLGLRLDVPLPLGEVADAIDPAALARLERLGLAERRDGALALTRRGRFLGGGVTAALMA
jgi:oxygen-independent coproporphyrinogen-3 oxidase